jgi:hypothetical protein
MRHAPARAAACVIVTVNWRFAALAGRLVRVGAATTACVICCAHAGLRLVGDNAQTTAPLLGVELSRLVLCDESLEHRDEAPGRLELG